MIRLINNDYGSVPLLRPTHVSGNLYHYRAAELMHFRGEEVLIKHTSFKVPRNIQEYKDVFIQIKGDKTIFHGVVK